MHLLLLFRPRPAVPEISGALDVTLGALTLTTAEAPAPPTGGGARPVRYRFEPIPAVDDDDEVLILISL